MIAIRICLCLLAVFAVPSTTWAFVEAKIPLERMAADSQVIVAGSVEKLDTLKMTTVLTTTATIKGDVPVARFNLKLAGTQTREHGVSPLDMAERLEPNSPFVAFVTHQPGSELIFLYCRGTWYRLSGTLSEGIVRGRFENSEPFLRRTYHDETAKLQQMLLSHISSSTPLPDVDATAVAGLGPRAGEKVSAIVSTAAAHETSPSTDSAHFEFFEETTAAARPAAGGLRYALLTVGLVVVVAMLVWSSPVRTTDGV